ncbi:MAG: hypothetical protein ACFFE2_02535 [Candidatus Thorarchaeota archaeon]
MKRKKRNVLLMVFVVTILGLLSVQPVYAGYRPFDWDFEHNMYPTVFSVTEADKVLGLMEIKGDSLIGINYAWLCVGEERTVPSYADNYKVKIGFDGQLKYEFGAFWEFLGDKAVVLVFVALFSTSEHLIAQKLVYSDWITTGTEDVTKNFYDEDMYVINYRVSGGHTYLFAVKLYVELRYKSHIRSQNSIFDPATFLVTYIGWGYLGP